MKTLLIIIFTLFLAASLQAEKRWVQSKPPKESHEQYDLLKCLDSNNCYAIGDLNDRIILYNSTNQGQSWKELFEKFDNMNTEIVNIFNCFITDTNNIYLTYTDRVALELSNNGGKSFRTILFGEISEDKNDYFFNITFYTKNISAGLTRNYLIYSYDNWESNTIVAIPDSITSDGLISFKDSNNIVFSRVDYHNTDFIKYDINNKDWSVWSRGSLVEDKYEDFYALQFVNDSLGYGCGGKLNGIAGLSNDIIWKTTDKGQTWVKLMNQLNDPGFSMINLAFRDEDHGIVVGNWGKIFETTDGGESWFQYPVKKEMASFGTKITWAGTVPFFAAWNVGIFRLETVTEVEELSSDEKFRVYQSGDNLEIAINDESYSNYKFSLYNSSGQSLMTRDIKSSFGFVFEPVELIDLTNGVYYYTISKNNGVEFTGKLVVVE